MRTVRIYEGLAPLVPNENFTLSSDGFGHLIRVLRFKEGDKFVVFDGLGHEFNAVLTQVNKQAVALCLNSIEKNIESPLEIELGQGISRGDKMEFTVQKAVELGVTSITPLTSRRCSIKLDEKREEKKVEQWQKIAISACEQCGRNYVPRICKITDLNKWCAEKNPDVLSLTLDPKAQKKLKDLNNPKKIRLLIGPEGGLSEDEIENARLLGFEGISLGPRILRTETAALTTLSILGSLFGDL